MKYGASVCWKYVQGSVGEGIKVLQWEGLKARESWCRRDPKAVDEADMVAEKQLFRLRESFSKEKTLESMEQSRMNKGFYKGNRIMMEVKEEEK